MRARLLGVWMSLSLLGGACSAEVTVTDDAAGGDATSIADAASSDARGSLDARGMLDARGILDAHGDDGGSVPRSSASVSGLAAAGGRSSSAHFVLFSVTGQLTPGGESASSGAYSHRSGIVGGVTP
ncbi:MAG: hypothetical protein U0353_15700 [Sandaracinus sp.]